MNIASTTASINFPFQLSSLAFGASHQRATFSLSFSPLSVSKTAMASAALRSPSPVPAELSDESDFESLVSADGYISICGFGSLLSGKLSLLRTSLSLLLLFLFINVTVPSSAERSARSTFPDLANFRTARLKSFRRVFAHVAPVFFERGIAKPETMVRSDNTVTVTFS